MRVTRKWRRKTLESLKTRSEMAARRLPSGLRAIQPPNRTASPVEGAVSSPSHIARRPRMIAMTGNALLGDGGCKINGSDNLDKISFWRTPVADCGGGKTCVPYKDWASAYLAIQSGQ